MKYNIIIIIVTICSLLCGIFLPGILINNQTGKYYTSKTATTISYNYEITPIMSRNASSRLSTYEQLKLICNLWDSTITQADVSEARQSPYEALTTARESIETLYQAGGYPCSVATDLKKRYDWTATLYKATDNSFHTYSVYYWKFDLALYGTAQTHSIWMTEDGTIFCAATNVPGTVKNLAYALSNPFTQNSFTLKADLTRENIPMYPQISLPYSNLELKDSVLWIVDNSNVRSLSDAKKYYEMNIIDGAVYYAYQLSDGSDCYMYTLIPYRPTSISE